MKKFITLYNIIFQLFRTSIYIRVVRHLFAFFLVFTLIFNSWAKPGKPVFVSSKMGPHRTSFKWTQATDSTQYFQIFRSVNSGSFSLYDSTHLLSYTDTSAFAGNRYTYSVRAVDSVGLFGDYADTISLLSNRIWWINTTGTDDPWSGFSTLPLKSVQFAVDRAQSGDTILLEQGTYTDAIYIDKSITLSSKWLLNGDTSEIFKTELSGNSTNRILEIQTLGSEKLRVSGLKLSQGKSTIGAGIYAQISTSDTLFLQNLIFSNNTADVAASSLYIKGSNSGVALAQNCIFTQESGPSLIKIVQSHLNLQFSTVYGNTLSNSDTCIVLTGGEINVKNSILYSSANSLHKSLGSSVISGSTNQINVSYSNVFGGWSGVGNISGDPKFVSGTLIPSNQSPVIARASSATSLPLDFNGTSRPIPSGSQPDLGAIESEFSLTVPSLDSISKDADTFFVFARIWQPEYKSKLFLEISDDSKNPIQYDSISATSGRYAYLFKEGRLENGKTYHFRIFQGETKADKDLTSTTFSEYVSSSIPLTAYNCRGLNDSIYTASKQQCIRGNHFEFINRSKETAGYSIVSHTWNLWGSSLSNQTSSSDTLKWSFSDSGTYYASITVKNNKGCVQSDTVKVYVANNPTANFTVNDTAQCSSNQKFVFSSASKSNVKNSTSLSLYWDMGDSSFTSKSNPINIYNSSGPRWITQIATNKYGCKDTVVKRIMVAPMPVSAIQIQDSALCFTGNSFQVSSVSSINAGGGNLDYRWRFEDYNSVKQRWESSAATSLNTTKDTAVKAFNSVGYKRVWLTATSSYGCKDSVNNQLHVIQEPQAQFVASATQVCFNQNVFSLSDQSVIGETNINQWKVSWGNGLTTTKNSSDTFQIHYSDTGKYTVRLSLIDQRGCKDTQLAQVFVAPNPNAAFSVNDSTQCLSQNAFQITQNSTSNSNNSSLNYSWSFGDGNSSSSASPNKTYISKGNYTMQLVASNIHGCTDTAAQSVRVYGMPSVKFSVNDSQLCENNGNAQFTNLSSIAPGEGILSWNWMFGNGNSDTTQTPSALYSLVSNPVVKLISTSSFGCTDSASIQLEIVKKPAIQTIVVNDSCLNSGVHLKVRDLNQVQPTSVRWAFSDNTQNTDTSLLKFFATEGLKNYELVVSNSAGCSDTVKGTIRVYENPWADFVIDLEEQCLKGNDFEFKDITNYKYAASSVVNYWIFGDGNRDTVASSSTVNHVYDSAATYPVILIAKNGFGCADTLQQNITVFPMPKAQFTINDSLQCLKGNEFKFNNFSVSNSLNSALDYVWDFGDTTQSVSTSPEKKYSSDGTRNIQLIVQNIHGCNDTSSSVLQVYPQSVPSFTINDTAQCENNNLFEFTSTSTVKYTGGTLSYFWNLGQGKTGSGSPVQVKYSNKGTAVVQLITTTSLGCKDSTEISILLQSKPQALVSKLNADSCLNNAWEFKVIDLKSPTISNVQWSFSDLTVVQDSIFEKSFSSAGVQTAQVVIANSNGCTDTVQKVWTVYHNPVAQFVIADDSLCLVGNRFQFNQASTTSSGVNQSYSWFFGDGKTGSTQANPQYTYSDSGNYSVRMEVTNSLGCMDTAWKTLRVKSNPQSQFTEDLALQCLHSNSTQFTDASTSETTGSTLIYSWNFGDSTSSSLKNPSKSYTWAGVKNVQLIVKNDENCLDTVIRQIEIKPEPVAAFSINNTVQCANNNQFILTDTSKVSSRGGSLRADWIAANGKSQSNSSNFILGYNSAGTYSIKLVSTSQYGCKDSIVKTIKLNPKPQTQFAYLSKDTCLTTTAILQASNAGKSGIKGVKWSFADNTLSQGVTVTKKYSSSGAKSGYIYLTDNLNCVDTLSFGFNVWKNPTSKFGTNTQNTCFSGNLIEFKDSSKSNSGSIQNVTWNFFDGTTQSFNSAQSTQHSYGSSGKYLVKHKVINSFGCQDSSTQWINITPNPIADFEVDNNSQCLSGNLFSFTDNSNPNNGISSLSYFWDFGDSSTATTKNPTHSYKYAGVKLIRLIILNTNGCTDTLFKQVTVRPQPFAQFSINTQDQCVNQQAYNFTDNSSVASGGGSLSRVWDLGDGSISNSSSVANKKYNSAASYKVKLTSKTSFGCVDSLVQNIRVLPKPNLSFTVNTDTQCLVGNSYGFYNSSSIVSGGGTVSYQWRFGDGSSSTNTHPSYSYTNYGSYSVRLLGTTQFGCVDSLKKSVSVIASPQTTFILSNSSTQCNSVDTFKLVNQTSALNGKNVKYTWQFGDGSSSVSVNPVKSFTNAGVYTIRLKAINSNGCADSASQKVTVNADPKADFAINQSGQCINNQQFEFKNNSTIAFGGGSMSFDWKYQDTSFSNSTNASSAFAEVKTYTIKLVAKSTLGCSDSISKQIVVYPQPKADFTVNNSQQCLTNNQFNFTNNSTISSGTNTYVWNYGDGTGSTSVSPSNTYSAFGKYQVLLKAVSNRNCEDTTSKWITVHSKPNVAYLRSDTTSCLYKNEFNFNSISSNSDGAALSYRWIYSDGKSDTGKSAKKSFSLTGKYTVKLIATSAKNCRDSFTNTVRIFPQPIPSFTINTSNQCLINNSYEATNNSTIASEGGTLSYTWDLGNSNQQTVKNPKWKYAQDDTFIVSLTVKSSLGCVDSLKKSVVVYPQPLIGFDIADSAQCFTNNRFTMSNVSNVKYGSIAYDWNFGNNQKSTGTSPVVSYSSFGKYTIRLTGKTNFGCMDSAKHDIQIFDVPKAAFTVNDAEQCLRSQKFSWNSSSYVPNNNGQLYWFFGDGNSQNGSNSVLSKVNYSYSAIGFYTVKLKVVSSEGCADSSSSIIRVDEHPKTAFTLLDSVQCINNNDFVFENKTSISKGKFNSFWDFGDVSYSNTEFGRHTYTKAGTYFVKLVTSSAFGCSDTLIKKVRVTNLPKIQFALNRNTSCLLNNSFVADNQSQYVGAETVNYTWLASDGTQMNNTLFQHQFAESGKYRLKLIGVTSEGCSDSIEKSIEVYPQGESKMVVLDTMQCLRGNLFNFGNESRVDGSRFAILSWNFGNGYIDTMYTSTPVVFEYGDTGTFKVELITTTENLCTDTSFGFVKVVEMPEANLLQNTVSACFNQQTFEFYDVSNKTVGVFNEWLFDKQIVTNTDTLTPHFIQPGKYRVSLVSKTKYGCTDTAIRFAIVNEIPQARIAVNNNAQCLAENDFFFSNISSSFSNPDEFWDFGDGSFGTGADINQYYTEAGNYTVELTVENDSLCSDTARMSIIVNPTPEAALSISPVCVNQPSDIVSNASISSGRIVSYQWDLGDGGNSADSVPTQVYRRPGKYYIRLEMNSDKGCFAGFLDSTEVYSNPEAYFTVQSERATILKPEVYVLDSSTNASTYEWDMNDGSDFYYDYEVKHTYQDTGFYRVRLVVASIEGCLDTFSRTIQVWPDYNILLPTAFSPNDDQFNDEYHIRGNHHSVRAANWIVYSSEGIRVFESKNIEDSWNGKLFNGSQELPSGEYELVLFVTDIFGKQAQFNQKVTIVK